MSENISIAVYRLVKWATAVINVCRIYAIIAYVIIVNYFNMKWTSKFFSQHNYENVNISLKRCERQPIKKTGSHVILFYRQPVHYYQYNVLHPNLDPCVPHPYQNLSQYIFWIACDTQVYISLESYYMTHIWCDVYEPYEMRYLKLIFTWPKIKFSRLKIVW